MGKLIMRGGYGEHGRSCFLVEYGTEGRMYMVDCGILDTDPFPYPHVTPEELARVDYLFLTHCHKDHSGAFEYFCDHGFAGTLVTTRMSCLLAGISYEKTEFLTVEEEGKNHRLFGNLHVSYGRTGHCPGGLWFEITDGLNEEKSSGGMLQNWKNDSCGSNGSNGSNNSNDSNKESEHAWSDCTIVFSGDYQEDTLVYRCDPIQNRRAKLALIDCAHRGTEMNAEELRRQIVDVVSAKRENGQRVILPVPQYGRGLELLLLMQNAFPKARIRVDADFVSYAEKMLSEKIWYYEDAYQKLNLDRFDVMTMEHAEQESRDACKDACTDHQDYDSDADYNYDILILADTHLKKQKNLDFVHKAIEAGEAVLINGRVKKQGPVGRLLDAGKAERFLFPHHQSYGDLKRVAAANQFAVVLPFHNNEKEVLV